MRRTNRAGHRGQALVEFSLTLIVFLVLLMAVVDLGRGIYMYNGVSQAAREIARVTSVHPGNPIGSSVQTTAVVATQMGLVPNLGAPTFSCVDIDDTPVAGPCPSGMQVKVTIIAPYRPITPLLGLVGTFNLSSASSVQIPFNLVQAP